MSIATELTNYKTYLTNAYNKCSEREAVIPANRNMQNITNCIDSINRYTELTYIESSGTQYIDTGVGALDFFGNFKIEEKAQFLTTTRQQYGAVSYVGNNDPSNLFLAPICIYNDNFFVQMSNTGVSLVSADTNIHTFRTDNQNLKAYIDGTSYDYTSSTSSTDNRNVYLLARNNRGTADQFCKKRIYYCKIYNGDTLVRDYIPVLDSNNVACMYDKVNNVFYYNQGTGTFTAGDVVLDYIESTGTQYLNTSVASEVNTKVNMKVMFPQISSSNAWFFGINYTNNFLVSLGVYASYPRFAYKSPNYVFSFSPTISTNTKYQVEAYFGASSQYVKVNGTTNLSKTESLVNGSNQGSFRLFNRLDQGDTNLNMRLYSCKIYKDDVLKADFIPVLKADTKEPCLYDKTRNLYKANLGTGTFLFG